MATKLYTPTHWFNDTAGPAPDRLNSPSSPSGAVPVIAAADSFQWRVNTRRLTRLAIVAPICAIAAYYLWGKNLKAAYVAAFVGGIAGYSVNFWTKEPYAPFYRVDSLSKAVK